MRERTGAAKSLTVRTVSSMEAADARLSEAEASKLDSLSMQALQRRQEWTDRINIRSGTCLLVFMAHITGSLPQKGTARDESCCRAHEAAVLAHLRVRDTGAENQTRHVCARKLDLAR